VKRYDSFEGLCDDPDVDAVSICLPNFLHEKAAVRAFEAGKHVMCEKPLADSVAGGQRIVEAAGKSGTVFMMNLHQRFTPGATHIRKLVDAGDFGDVYYSFSSYLRHPGGIPSGVGGWFYRKAQSGGGALLDNGVHLIDQQWYLMGCPQPVEAMGKTYTKFGPDLVDKAFDVDDFAAGMVRFENDAVLMFDNAWASILDEPTHFVRVLGTKMGGTAQPFKVTRLKGTDCEDVTPDKVETENPVAHFVRCIREGATPVVTPEQGLTMLKIVDALYRSAESGSSATID
jgi:predicted dehydrogenase